MNILFTTFKNNNLFTIYLPLVVSVFISSFIFFYPQNFISFENFAVDTLQKSFPRKGSDQKIFVIDIDEKSLKKKGQWPWPREELANLTKILDEYYNVKAIGFDILFPEADRFSKYRKSLNLQTIFKDSDTLFGESIGSTKKAVLPIALNSEGKSERLPNLEVTVNTIGNQDFNNLRTETSYVQNIHVLNKNSSGIGFINSSTDRDGLIRKAFLFSKITSNERKEALIPSFSLELVRVYLNQPSHFIKFSDDQTLQIKLDKLKLSLPKNALVTPHLRKMDREKYISVTDILEKKSLNLKNSIVIIGASAVGLNDRISTSLEKNIPGTEIHLQLIESILDNKLIQRKNIVLAIEYIASIFSSLILVIVLTLLNPIISFLITVFAIGCTALTSLLIFKSFLIFFNPLSISICLFFTWSIFTISKRIIENKERAYVDRAFGRYVSPTLLNILYENPSSLALGGSRKNMTFLFCDIRNFSKISEIYETDPQKLVDLINKILDPISKNILDQNGTIDKYLGDGIMAFWNAPVDDCNHTENAIKAAMKVLTTAKEVNERIKDDTRFSAIKQIPVEVGIGINTGYATVGNIGSSKRFDYSVIGDPVNLAARLESQCKYYSLPLIIGENTVKELLATNTSLKKCILLIDNIKVMGKEKPTNCYTMLNPTELKTFNVSKHKKFMDLYKEGKFDEAIKFTNDITNSNTPLKSYYKMLNQRIVGLKSQKDLKWKGFYELDRK